MGGHHHAHDHGGRQGSELAGAAFRWSIALNSGLTASVQPHRQKTFKLSTDPFFVEKVTGIVGLYLNPPDKAIAHTESKAPAVEGAAIQGVLVAGGGSLIDHLTEQVGTGRAAVGQI